MIHHLEVIGYNVIHFPILQIYTWQIHKNTSLGGWHQGCLVTSLSTQPRHTGGLAFWKVITPFVVFPLLY